MRTEKQSVSGANVPAGTQIDVKQCDSVEEALEFHGPDKCLRLINKQYATDEKNAERRRWNEKVKQLDKYRAKAMASMTPEEFASLQGDAEAIEAFILDRCREIRDASK